MALVENPFLNGILEFLLLFAALYLASLVILFSVGLTKTEDAPGFHEAVTPITALFANQWDRLHRLSTSRERDRNARAIFAAVHGLVALGDETRVGVVAPGDLDRMISRVVGTLCEKEQKL